NAVLIACSVSLLIFEIVRYPVQSRKPHFASAAPALIEPAKALLHGRDPYSVQLDENTPVSPGPGWILLLAPLTLSGGVMLVTPLAAVSCAMLLRKSSPVESVLFLPLLLMQPDLLSQTSQGHDLFAVPLCFAIICLLLDRFWTHGIGLLAIAVFAGLLATSRIPMVVLPLIAGLGLSKRSRSAGITFTLVSTGIATLLPGIFYIWASHDHVYYQPLHLFFRAAGSGFGFVATGAFLASSAAIWIYITMRDKLADWVLGGAVILIAAFGPIGLGEIRKGEMEGCNYVSFAASLLIAYICLRSDTAGVPLSVAGAELEPIEIAL
ncbi:MAG: hypothetical protein ACRYGF_00950, partial [Janthinobacterium lividum]